MAKFDSYAPGQFSWVDLMAPDVAAATAFYGALFGWSAEASQDDAGGGYTMFQLGGVDVAGMGVMPDEMKNAGQPPFWNSYVTVADADATAARVEELGGQLQMPVIDIAVAGERVGRMTTLADPVGARLSIWQPGRHAGSGLANLPGTFCWNELCTPEVDRAVEFYEALFDWKVLPGDEENGYREIVLAGRLNGGILPWREEMGDVPSAWSAYFAVEDCDAAVAKIEALGGSVLMGPVDIATGRFAVVADDRGGVFDVAALDNPDP